jgi:phosphatidylglycerophosphate synthase
LSEDPAYREARREHRSLTAVAEKKALVWMAERMPAGINSDHLTALGLLAFLGGGISYALVPRSPLWLHGVNVCLVLNWLGDSLDGTLARVRNCQRPRYGYYVDHVVDVVGTLFLFGGMALSGFMSPGVAAALLIAYYLLSLEVYLATHSLGTFQMSFFKMGPTELRILLAIGAIALFWNPMPIVFGHRMTLFDLGGAIGAAGLIVTFVVSAVRNGRALYQMEKLEVRS